MVVRRLHHGGNVHFVIEQPDGTRALLPAWMTEPWAAQLTIIERPRLTLEALHALHSVIDGALLSLSSSSMMRGSAMMERPAGRRQLDLLVRAANALEPNRIPPTMRADVTFLLTLLMAEYLAADTAPPAEASNE